ncbi:MAG: HYR domain-containing protein [Bacteroidota bacterium]
MNNLMVFINQNFLRASVNTWLPFLFSCLFIMASGTLFAQVTWEGDVSSDWDDGTNWLGNTVPNAASEVVIPAGTPFSAILSSTTIIKKLTLSGELTIDVGAELYVTGVSTNLSVGIDEKFALLTVRGTMTVEGDNTGNGFRLHAGTLRVDDGAEMTIRDCRNDGLVLEADLEDVLVEINGHLTVENIRDDGIDLQPTPNTSQLTVGATGRIDIKDHHSNANDLSHGISCNEIIVNNGEIEIVNMKGDGIALGEGNALREMTNNGSLVIEDARYGITMVDNAQFTNGAGATISIMDIIRDGIRMDEDTDVLNDTYFDNHGEILLGSQTQPINRFGMLMVETAFFTNHSTGSLVISYAGETGIITEGEFNNPNVFNNYGSVLIEYSAFESFYMTKRNNFNNYENATFTIKDPLNGSGINMDEDHLKRVDNFGTIEILNVPQIGLLMGGDDEARFVNDTTGSLIITNPGFRGIDPGNASSWAEQIFKNSGYVEITVTGEAMIQQIDFENRTGGILAGYGDIRGGTLVFEDSCILSPGTSTELGVINFANINPDLQGIMLNMDIEGTAGPGLPGGHDQITLEDVLTIDGATLNLTGSHVPATGDLFVLIDNTSTENSNDTFDGLEEGDTLTFNGELLQITYEGLDGNEVVVFPAQPTWTGNTSEDWNDPTNWFPEAVPGPDNDVFIPNVNTHDPVIDNSLVANVKSVTIRQGGDLFIGPTGQLNIDGSDRDAMKNRGDVRNEGTIVIGMNGSIPGNGITNENDFVNFGGIIQIGNIDGSGIYNNGASFRNRQGGEILIGHSFGTGGFTGLRNDGANTEFWNFGNSIIKIDSAIFDGLLNENGASFLNEERAKIIIGENGDMFATFGFRCTESSVFSNVDCALLHLQSNNQLLTNGTFINDGRLINESTSLANITTNNGFVVNLNGGVFVIGTNNGFLLTSIDASWTGCDNANWHDRDNWLHETIPTNTSDVFIRDVLYNDPRVSSTTPAEAKSVLVETGGYLTINDNRTLNINGSTGHGLENHGQIDNLGNLNIGQVSAIADRGILNENIFNNDGGDINIDNTGTQGIFNHSPFFENKNDGEIRIGQNAGNVGSQGIRNTGAGNKFLNDQATIEIDNTSNSGILNTLEAEFINTNDAQVTIGGTGNIIGNALHNTMNASFENTICSEIALFNILRNEAPFTNEALVRVDAIQNSIITESFDNLGIIEDVQATVPASSPFMNNTEFIVASTKSNDCENISPAFNLGNPQVYAVLGVFTNANATNSAGTYDVGTNTFTPATLLADGTHTFYVKFEDTVNNCEFIVFWELITVNCCPQFVTCYLDNDNDGFGDPSVSQVECQTCSSGYVADNTDCDDNDPTEFPGQTWYLDGDNDGYSDGSTQTTCERPADHKTAGELTSADLDCNDNDGTINPGAVETCNGIDDDCDNLFDSNDPSYTDTEEPSLSCPANRNVNMHPGQCGAVVNWPTPNATDNCDGTFAASQTMGDPSGSLFVEGVQTLEYTATDAAGNFETCTFTITVQPDAQKPSLSCPSNLTVPMDAGQCGAVVNWATPDATDNCDGTFAATQTQGDPSGSFFTEGTHTIEYTAADMAGNEESCTFTVTVQPDAEKPALACPANIDVAMDAGQCGATVNWPTPDATDNCDGTFAASQTMGDPSGSLFAEGTQTIEYTAIDNAGNEESCSFTVSVQPDAEKPALGCPANIDVAMDAGQCGAVVNWPTPDATDNCDGTFAASQTMGDPSGSLFAEGTQTIEYTAIDNAGNEESCSFTVSVQPDAEKPALACPANIDVAMDAGQCGAVVNWPTPDATDNCDGTFAASQTMGDPGGSLFAEGIQTIEYTAIDNAGNEESCTFTVTVQPDAQKPSVSCPSNLDVPMDAGQCGAVVNWATPDATDNCVGTFAATQTQGDPSGSFFTEGTHTIEYTAADAAGNEESCTFTVSVQPDAEKPALLCPADIDVAMDAGQCGAVVNWPTPDATDNCDGTFAASQTVGDPGGSLFAEGTQTIEYTAIDNAGNEESCSFTVTVQPDTEKPALACPANIDVAMDAGQCGATVNWPTPDATDNCDGTFAASQITGNPSGSLFAEGTQTIEYTAIDNAGNEESCSFTVTVQPDAEKPALACPADIDVAMDAGKCGATVNWPTPDATDNCDGIFAASQTMGDPSGSLFAEGIQTIEYTAIDNAGNEESCSFTVTVQPDAEKPALACPANIDVAMDAGQCGATVNWPTPDATDNCDGTFAASQITGNPSGSLFAEGAQTIKYTAIDNAGNEESCTFTVTVQPDAELPVPTCKSNVPVELNGSGNYTIQESDVLDSGTDNCGTVNYVGAAPAIVDCTNVGNHVSVTVTVNDGNGNKGICTATVVVSDSSIPTPACLNPTIQLDANGTYTLSEAEVFNGGTDNCGDVTFVSAIPATVDCSYVGNSPVAITVTGTDEYGNENTCTANVTVEDKMAPSAVCLHPSISLNEDGTVNLTGADVVDFDNSTDNCNDVFFVNTSPAVFNCADVGGSVPVLVTISDDSGNESTCTAQVTLLLPATCNGTMRTWTGSVSSDWNDPCNWNPICVPTVQDEVTIPATANDPVILTGADAFAKSVEVQTDATLTIENSGSLIIDDATSDGIFNQGTIENAGEITIGSNGFIAGFGIFNSSVFNNLNGAVIHIDQVQNSAVINITGGVFTNEGVINIGQKGIGSIVGAGINNINVFHNDAGSIYIDHTGSEGVFNSSTGNFTNKAFIAIGQNGGADNIGSTGISNFGIFKIENGEIQIENTLLDGFGAQGIDGEFLNLSILGIRNVGRFGTNFLSGSFENQGEISIEQTGQAGLKCQSDLPLENSGTISIVNTQEHGVSNQGTIHNDGTLQVGLGAGSNNIAFIGIENEGDFKNTLNGEVHIANTTEKGFVNGRILDNEGTFFIGQVGSTLSNIMLLGLENYGTVNNLQGGVFHINHISEIGLFSDDAFHNEGTINIGEPNGVTSILNTGLACTNQFYNKPGGVVFIGNCGGSGLINNEQYQNEICATTTIQDDLQNFGAFNNLGLLTLDTDENHMVGNFTNNGIVEDVQGGFVGATNNEIIIAPVIDDCVEVNPAFQLGSPVDFNILGVYTDENATIPAGTYDLTSNTFTSNIGVGQFDLFVEIEDPINGCTRIVSWSVDFGDSTPPVPNCTSNVTVTLDANGSYTIQESDVFAGGTDNCGTVNYVGAVPALVDCSDVSNNPSVLVTVNDGNGNEATCTSVVNVADNSNPVPVCLNPTVELDGTGNYTLMQNEVFDGGTDNCSTISFLSMSPESVDCSHAGGTVQVTVTAIDASGNQATCTANVTVEDNTTPGAVCLHPNISLNEDGTVSLTGADVVDFVNSTDNCNDVFFVGASPAVFNCTDVGAPVPVQVTISDNSGNESTCTAQVTLLLPATCNGTLRTWTGAISSDWNDPCNWNPICVPTVQEDVIIPTAANDPVIMNGNNAFAKSIQVETGTSLTINNNASLAIDNSSNVGILNEGTVDNYGTIIIGANQNIDGEGIYNWAAFNNHPGGSIQIEGTNSSGIINRGTFANFSSINMGTVKSIDRHGIENWAVFNNNPGGDIQINRTDNDGIINQSGTFTNAAKIMLGAIHRTQRNGISNRAVFNNHAGGDIQVFETQDGKAISNDLGTFTNAAKITIGAIVAVREGGIQNGATFNNDPGGDIQIFKVDDGHYIQNLAGTFTNAANIKIEGNNTGDIGILNLANFYNNAGGDIQIDETNDDGISNSSNFFNFDRIIIGSIATIKGNGIINEGFFGNDANGLIQIDNTRDNGLTNASDFQNSGEVHIGQSAPNSIGLTGLTNEAAGLAVFQNKPGAVVKIDNTQDEGILNQGWHITNEGQINIGGNGPIGTAGIFSTSTFDNLGCAEIYLFKNMDNSGTFTNEGLLSLNTLDPHTVGNFINNGIVEDIQGGFVGATNNEIIIAPVIDDCVEVNPAFQLGSPVDFNILGIYTDENATMPAGTYDLASNTFISNIGAGQFDLFVEIEDPVNGCARIVSWSVDFGDSTPPVPNCTSNVTVTLDANGSYTIQESDVFAGGTDNCGTVNFVGIAPATVDCSDVSSNPSILVTVNDGNGNEATCTALINVEDNSDPEPTCLNPTVELDGTGNYTLMQSEVFDGGTDNCSTISFLSMSPESVDCSHAGSTVQVMVTAFDASGNQATCTANVLVEDNEIPEPDCLSPTVSLNALGSHTLSENEVFGGGTDNCGAVTFIEMSPVSVGCGDVGAPVEVTVLAQDANGNQNSCTAVVTVVDALAPIASCKDITIELDSDGNAGIDESQINNGSSDNCGIASLALDITEFGCVNVGTNTVQLAVTDVNGNVENCTATVTVEDQIAPEAKCTTTVINVSLDTNGEYTIDPYDLDDGSNDACGILGFSAAPVLFDCQNVGSNTVTLTVTDVNGNTANCTATVQVADFITIDNIFETAESCAGTGDGGLTIEATVGGGQIGYSIDGGVNFQFNHVFNSLSPGTYNVVVKAFGIPAVCEATSTASIVTGGQPQTWYRDMDGDQYSDGISVLACSQPAGYYLGADLLSTDGDCNDNEVAIHPGAVEICDGFDNNCDGQLMAGEIDADGDGFLACMGDCDDSNPNVYPGAVEICNGIDDDCDGEIDEGTTGGLTWTGNIAFYTQADVDVFSQCYSIIDGHVFIQGNDINNLVNLFNLEEITGDLTIQVTGLTSMAGLDNLVEVGGILTIYYNSSLITLDGLDALGAVGSNLSVYYNFALSDGCAIYNLINGGVGGTVSIFVNASGCNSVAEINANCGPSNLLANPNTRHVLPVELSTIQKEILVPDLHIFPNPATSVTTLRFEEPIEHGNIMVSDLAGREIWQKKVKEPMDQLTINLSDWRAGVYYVLIKMEGRKLMTKKLIVADKL